MVQDEMNRNLYEYDKPHHDNQHLYDLTYKLNKEYCMEVFEKNLSKEEIYEDPKHGVADNWKVVRLDQFDYADEIIENLGLKGYVTDYKPRFYLLEANTYLKTHVDYGTKCSLNFIVNGGQSPVTFEDELELRPNINSRFSYRYDAALFNTQRPHGVVNDGPDRVLFKISIFDKDYNEVRKKIKENTGGHSYNELGGSPKYQKFRDKFDGQKSLGDKYYDLHTSNLIPTNMKIDLDLFHDEVQNYQDLFEQWGPRHSDLPRTGLALTKPKVDIQISPNPANWPMDRWAIEHPDLPLVDTDFTEPTEAFLQMKSLQPLMEYKDYFARCNLLRWHDTARFLPHVDVMDPFHNLRLWGTNDPDNYSFCFWNELQGEYVKEENVEAGRIYIADTAKWHHAYCTADNNYQFFISLQVDAYDKIRKNLL